MSRINIVREIKDKTNRNAQAKMNSHNFKREQGWNDRFTLGKIPEYNSKRNGK